MPNIDALSVDQLVVAAGTDAIPPAARLASKYSLPLAYIREGGAKDHGTRQQIEGGRPEAHRGGKVILVIGHDMEMAEAEAAFAVYEMKIVEVIYASLKDK